MNLVIYDHKKIIFHHEDHEVREGKNEDKENHKVRLNISS